MPGEELTREAMGKFLLHVITAAEGKKLIEAPREYTLELVKEIFSAIDGRSAAAPVMNTGRPKR